MNTVRRIPGSGMTPRSRNSKNAPSKSSRSRTENALSIVNLNFRTRRRNPFSFSGMERTDGIILDSFPF